MLIDALSVISKVLLFFALGINGLFLVLGRGDIEMGIGFLCVYTATRVIRVNSRDTAWR